MDDKILFFFEGAVTEGSIFAEIKKHIDFGFDDEAIICIFGNNIYALNKALEEDPDLDIVELIREKHPDKLDSISRQQVSQVYLFFDYDDHDSSADDRIIDSYLNLYNNETENGKLYISYPAVEAFRHLNYPDKFDFYKRTYQRKRPRYKEIVNEQSCNKYKQLRKLTTCEMHELILVHLIKAYLISNGFDLASVIDGDLLRKNLRKISQEEIFKFQKDLFLTPQNSISVLGAFSFFVHDYFGVNTLSILESGIPLIENRHKYLLNTKPMIENIKTV